MHIDMTKVEAEIAAAIAALSALSGDNGSVGAQARASIVVDTAFSRFLAQEINRGTSVGEVSDALAAVCANMISSLAQSAGAEGPEQMASACEAQMMKIARCLQRQFDGTAEQVFHGSVDLEDGGHA